MMSRKICVVLSSVALMGFLGTGCAATKKTVGVSHEVQLAAEPDAVVTAAKAALTDLKMEMVAGTGTKVDGVVTARTAQGKDVTIKIKSTGDKVSTMTVQVGAMGDSAVSDAIIAGTKKRL